MSSELNNSSEFGVLEDSSSAIQKIKQDLYFKIRRTFKEDDPHLKEIELQELIMLINQIHHQIMEQPQLQEIFDQQFLSILNQYFSRYYGSQIKLCVILLQQVISRSMISKRLFNLNHVAPNVKLDIIYYCIKVIDLINQLLIVHQVYQHTIFELPLFDLISALTAILENNSNQIIHATIRQLQILQSKTNQSTAIVLKKCLNENKVKNFIMHLQVVLTQSQSLCEQYKVFTEISQQYFPQFLEQLDAQDESNCLYQLLQILERYVFDTDYIVMLQINDIHETKNYQLKTEKQLIKNHISIYYACAQILNKVLSKPDEIQLQTKAFSIIKRLYEYFPQLHEVLYGPIKLVLINISLFQMVSSELKDSARFYYYLCHNSNYSEQQKQDLLYHQQLNYLKISKYYGKTTLEQGSQIFNLKNLNIQVMFPNKYIVNASSIYNYTIYLSQKNGILYYNAKVAKYDIRFGIFKLKRVDDYGIMDYRERLNGIETIQEIQIMNNTNGVVLLKEPGVYRLIFDNSYSLFRSKELYYYIHVLE